MIEDMIMIHLLNIHLENLNYIIQGYSIVSVCIIVEVFLLQGHSLPFLPLPFGIVACANCMADIGHFLIF